jgi:hypothetical protein
MQVSPKTRATLSFPQNKFHNRLTFAEKRELADMVASVEKQTGHRFPPGFDAQVCVADNCFVFFSHKLTAFRFFFDAQCLQYLLSCDFNADDCLVLFSARRLCVANDCVVLFSARRFDVCSSVHANPSPIKTCFPFSQPFSPQVRSIRHSLEPIEAKFTLLIVYSVVGAINKASRLILRLNGFQRLSVSGFHYWYHP